MDNMDVSSVAVISFLDSYNLVATQTPEDAWLAPIRPDGYQTWDSI